MTNLEKYFNKFRKNIVGINQAFLSPYGEKRIVYADWVASGRLYLPIEEKLLKTFGPFVGNTHTETSITGTTMTRAYREAHTVIKQHVGASDGDAIITAGFGMTTVINKLQRILGLKVCEQLGRYIDIPKDERPVVFITHMEHHSNHTTWLETISDVVVLEPNDEGLVNYDNLENELHKYKSKPVKIGSFTACSNVTGIKTDYHRLAKIMHKQGGSAFIDFSASAPYVPINMHPADPEEKLDAIFFSPHKFLGGPGTSGVLVFDKKLYYRHIPDHPGGGTVDWTNPWGEHKYINNIEAREDGGTPGFLQAIKTALTIKLKEEMGCDKILAREEELLKRSFKRLCKIKKINLLACNQENRLGIISFYVEDMHYNLIVKLLNDKFGIQVRGGCSCAGTYGHYLLHVDPTRSKRITEKIDQGDLSDKPGWVRFSLHPTMTDADLDYCIDAIEETVMKGYEWAKDYIYSSKTNEFTHKSFEENRKDVKEWFDL